MNLAHDMRPAITAENPSSYVAIVLEVDATQALIGPRGRPASPVRARLAVPRGEPLSIGDEVLALGCGGETLVIACLSQRAPELRAPDGALARVGKDGTGLEIRNADGALLLRYEAGRITVESDAVTLHARRGDLELKAAGKLVLAGTRMELRSHADGAAGMELGPEGIRMRAARAEVDAIHYEHRAQTTTVSSGELRSELGYLHARVERIETVAGQVVQRARNLYQQVEQLAQQRVGRLRMLVDQTLQVQAKRALTRTEGSYRVRAESIHLG